MPAWDAGIRVGLSYQFGTQGNRIGVNSGSFVRNNELGTEAFLSLSSYKNFTHIETDESGRESQLSVGLTQAFGQQGEFGPYDWSLAANNTNRPYSISLYSNLYRDTYETSQRTLGLSVNVNDVSVRFENDYDPTRILGDYGDRYRTAALEVGYRISDNNARVVTGINLFTGDVEQGGVISPEEGGAGKYGSYSLVQASGEPVNGRDRSIGNAYVGIRGLDLADDDELQEALGLDNLQMRIGWSSEGIRDITQNRLHDLIKNPQVPLREVSGKPYVEIGTNHGQTLYP